MFNTADENAARSAVTKCVRSMYERGELDNKPMLLTPRLLRAFEYSHTYFTEEDIIFLGFNKLMVPMKSHFNKDVWIVDSNLDSAGHSVVDGSVNYLNSGKSSAFKEVKGISNIDNHTFEQYRALRKRKGEVKDSSFWLRDEDTLKEMLLKSVENAPKINFIEYLENYAGIEFLYNKNDNTYTVRGPIILAGPYSFDIPSNVTVIGDLRVVDHITQVWPDDMRVRGQVEVRSFFI